MKAALVTSFDTPPQYGTFDDPIAQSGELIVEVHSSALSQLSKSQAAGKHYSSEVAYPFIPGTDGVGTTSDGQRVYFAFPRKPFGAMAEQVPVRHDYCVALPAGLDDVTAAAIANPGMSSWAALTRRAYLQAGETVLINGATGTSGSLAIQITKHLGAGKVIATGRNKATLETLKTLGADEIIALEGTDEELTQTFRQTLKASGVNVILDYLWGKSAEQIITAISGSGLGAAAPRIRFVQIGSLSGPTVALSGSALRSSGLELLGSGLGSIAHTELLAAIGELMHAVLPANLSIATQVAPLAEIETAWNTDTGGRRLVFTL